MGATCTVRKEILVNSLKATKKKKEKKKKKKKEKLARVILKIQVSGPGHLSPLILRVDRRRSSSFFFRDLVRVDQVHR